jgi:hypothetical protein
MVNPFVESKAKQSKALAHEETFQLIEISLAKGLETTFSS